MSLFSAFGQKGFAALASTLENIGNIVAPVPEDEQGDGEYHHKQRQQDGNEDQDDEEDTFESRIHSFINSKRLEIDNPPPSMDPQQSPNGSLIDIDLNDDDSDASSVDHSFQNYSKQKESIHSPGSTTSASSGVFLSNNELEKRVQMKYRESLEAEIASFNTKLREVEIRSQQNISRIQHDCDYWKDVAEAQRSEISKLKSILDETPVPSEDNSELAAQYEECRQTNEQLAQKLTQSEAELSKLTADFSALQSQWVLQGNEVLSLKNQLQQMQHEHSALQIQHTALQQAHAAAQSGNESNQGAALMELQQILETKSSEVLQLQTSLQDALRLHADAVSQKQTAVQSLSDQLHHVESQLRSQEALLASENNRWNDLLTQSETALKDAETVAWTCKAEASELLFAMQLAESKAGELQQETEHLRQQVADLTAENSSLRARNSQEFDEALSREHSAASELKDLQQIAGFLKTQLTESQTEVERLTAESVALQTQLTAAQEETQTVRVRLNETQKALENAELTIATVKAEAHTTLTSSESEHQEHDMIVAALKDQIESLNALLTDSQKRLEDVTNQHSAVENELRQQVEESRSEIVRLQSQVSELTAQLRAAQSVLSEDAEKLNQTLEASRRREAELEQLVSQLRSTVEEQRQTIVGLENAGVELQHSQGQTDQLNQDLSRVRSHVEALQSELATVKEECLRLASALKESSAAQHRAEQQLEHHTADSKNVLVALKKEVEKCQDLQGQNAALREQLTAAQSGMSADAEKMHQELQQARQHQAEWEQQLNHLAATNADLMKTVSDLQSGNAHLQSESAAHQSEVTTLKSQIASVKEEILSLTVNLEQSRSAQHAAEQRSHQLETESHNVLVALQKEVEKCQELQRVNLDLKEQLAHSSSAVAPTATAAPVVVVEDSAQLSELQSKLEALQTEQQRLETEKASLAALVEQKSKHVEDLSRQLQEQVRYTEMSVKSAVEAKAAAEAELVAIRNSGADMNSQVNTSRQQIQKLETENRQLHQVIAQLRQVRKTNKGEEENLLVERDELKTQNVSLLAEVARLDKLAAASASNADQIVKFRAELNAALNKSLYLEQALDETKRQLASLERDYYNKTSQLDIVSSDLMLAKQDLDLSQLEVRNLKDALSLIQVEQQNEAVRMQQELEARTKQLQAQMDQKQKELWEQYAGKYEECLQRCKVAEQQMQDEQLFRRRAELDFNNEKKKVQKTLESALQQLNNTQQDVVDRMLISNLIVSYFKRRRSMEVMELIAKVLQFNEEQKVVVGLKVAPVNLISSIFATVIGSAPAVTAAAPEVEGENLAEQWINFLITEAENGKAPSK